MRCGGVPAARSQVAHVRRRSYEAADAVFIELLVSAPVFQGGNYVGVSWRRVFVASALGNAVSYFIGVIGSHSPWIMHEAEAMDL